MVKRAWYYGCSIWVMGLGLTSDVEEVNAEHRVCLRNSCANSAVSPVLYVPERIVNVGVGLQCT